MRTIQIALHALPEELLSLVEGWLAEGRLFAAVIRIHPEFSTTQLRTADELRNEVSRNGVPFRICVAHHGFNGAARTLYDFMGKNEGECVVDIGALSDRGLKESNIVMSSERSDEWKFWAKVARQIRRTTSCGLWVVNPMNGARGFRKTSRYTAGAAKLAKTGVKLLPIAGWNYFELEDEAVS